MDFLLDTDGDLAIVNGDLVLVSGIDETIQFLTQSLKLFLGEWFLDESKGLPYFDEVFVKNPDPVALDSIFKKYIIELPGIQELLEFSLDYDPSNRTLTVSGRFRALDGEADFSVSNILPGGA